MKTLIYFNSSVDKSASFLWTGSDFVNPEREDEFINNDDDFSNDFENALEFAQKNNYIGTVVLYLIDYREAVQTVLKKEKV